MGLFGGDSATVKTSSKPYDAQRHKLEYGFNEAKDIYQQGKEAGPYDGQTYQGYDPQTLARLQGYQGANSGLLNSMNSAAQGNLQAGQGFGQNAQNIYGQYGGNATQGVLGNAQQYMNDPHLQGSIDAAKHGIYQDLQTKVLPSIGLGAEAGGNVNSSRAGVAQAIASRDAMQQAGNTEATMREDAYNRAIGQGSQDYFGGAQTALAANGQVGSALGMGSDLANSGMGYQNSGLQGNLASGGALQQNAQQGLNDAYQQYGYQNGGYQQGLLNNYWNIVGGQNWGGTSSQPVQGGTGTGQGLLGAGLAIGGMATPGGGSLLGGALGKLF
jgi:hypothetical protein